ncbi:uncharacterized protein Dmoj_GI26950 [Drosophila mojavensis]|uniref:Pre-C2HC domain-containing protein n=1 Tax=Drosophila mojavensis TaxID=7230 RepID=A0A0Q9X8V2_DROMO|nr:uncharacterized protein Dmoj_GI26950 [Drosophila mojavensis]
MEKINEIKNLRGATPAELRSQIMHEIAAIENNAEQSNDSISINTSHSSSGQARSSEIKTSSFAVGSFSLVKSQRKPLPCKRKSIASSPHDSPTSSNPKRSSQSTSQKPTLDNTYRNRFEALTSDSDDEEEEAMSTEHTNPPVSLTKVLEQCTANHRKQQDKLKNTSAQPRVNKQSQLTPKSNIPPITIPRLTDLPMLQELLKNNKLYGSNKVQIRTSAGGLTRLYAQDIETFRAIQNLFETVNLEFYTYQLKQDRPYKFVIKGLHHSTLHSAIKNELGSLGFNVTNIHCPDNTKRPENPIDMFFISIAPGCNKADLKNIIHLDGQRITIEEARKKQQQQTRSTYQPTPPTVQTSPEFPALIASLNTLNETVVRLVKMQEEMLSMQSKILDLLVARANNV